MQRYFGDLLYEDRLIYTGVDGSTLKIGPIAGVIHEGHVVRLLIHGRPGLHQRVICCVRVWVDCTRMTTSS